MKKYICAIMLILFSALFVSIIDAHAEYQHKSYNYFYDSQGNYEDEIQVESGASDEDATLRSIVVYFHIKDSEGVIHSLLVSTAFWTRPDTNTSWSFSYGWFVGYPKIREFFDKHTSD